MDTVAIFACGDINLIDDISEFNRNLMRYLIWYNTQRAQQSSGNTHHLDITQTNF